MDFRFYLVKHRITRDLNKILIEIGQGIKQIHSLGYVHRDLKPNNVVMNLKPFQLKIIDFNRSYLITQSTKGTVRGTPGYFPINDNLKDGSVLQDIWAFAAIILESDMDVNEYKGVMSERGSLAKATKHLEKKEVCDNLKDIIRGTL